MSSNREILSLILAYWLVRTGRQQAVGGMVLGSVALVAAFALLAQQRGNAVPFTAQEWWWAMNGGYLDTMVAHFVRNGGL